MIKLVIDGKEYKVQYGYNSFCDSDLLERVMKVFAEESNESVSSQIRDMFVTVRELLYVGFKKHNPVMNIEEVGDLLDTYMSEGEDGEDRGIIQLFNLISEELAEQGFLASLFKSMMDEEQEEKPKKNKKATKMEQ